MTLELEAAVERLKEQESGEDAPQEQQEAGV